MHSAFLYSTFPPKQYSPSRGNTAVVHCWTALGSSSKEKQNKMIPVKEIWWEQFAIYSLLQNTRLESDISILKQANMAATWQRRNLRHKEMMLPWVKFTPVCTTVVCSVALSQPAAVSCYRHVAQQCVWFAQDEFHAQWNHAKARRTWERTLPSILLGCRI